MEFPGFLGNDSVKEALRSAFSAGRFPHAVIFQGEAGCGKRTLAGLVAKALVCRVKEAAPCGVCPSCRRAEAGSHPDIRVIEGAGATRSLSVDAVRAMLEDAYRMPEEADYNVYIVHFGSRTLDAAQNKLLKLVEEPPKGTVFLMISPSAEAVLPTIRSRAQIFTLRPPEIDQAAGWLVQHRQTDPARARELAALCGGNIGRMLGELEGGGAGQAMGIAVEMAEAMLSSGAHRLLAASAPLLRDRALFREVLGRLGVIFRDAVALRSGYEEALGGAPEAADKLCALPMRRLARLPDLTQAYLRKLDGNANQALLVTCFCAELAEN